LFASTKRSIATSSDLKLTSAQKKALRDIQDCRTAVLGGQMYQCDHCEEKRYSYHSCRNSPARSVTAIKPSAGLSNSASGYCQFRTISSRSPYRNLYVRWFACNRSCFTAC
jgi:hypothetical protein